MQLLLKHTAAPVAYRRLGRYRKLLFQKQQATTISSDNLHPISLMFPLISSSNVIHQYQLARLHVLKLDL